MDLVKGLKILIGIFLYKLGKGYYTVSNQMCRLNIKKSDVVLEVGSGFSPEFRSDILLEKFLSDTKERQKTAIIDERSFIVADAANLPFLDHSIDYIYCSHVLEYVPDPGKILDEFKRVSLKGYIETPSELWGKLHPGDYHKWYISVYNNTLIFLRKEKTIFDDYLAKKFAELNSKKKYRKFRYKSDDYYLVKFEWDYYNERPLDYKIIEIEKDKEMHNNKFVWGNFDKDIKPGKYKKQAPIAKRIIRKFYKSPPINIYKILACPPCKSKLKLSEKYLICNNCGVKYPIIDGIPVLLKKKSISI